MTEFCNVAILVLTSAAVDAELVQGHTVHCANASLVAFATADVDSLEALEDAELTQSVR